MKITASVGIILLIFYSCNSSNTNANNPPSTQTTRINSLPIPPCAISASDSVPVSIFAKYQDAINVDSTKAVFAGHTYEFAEAYRKMIGDFANYLQKKESFKKKSISFWNRVYFQPNGTIDYYFYHFKAGALTIEEEALFKKSLNEFIKTYKFPMTAKVPFAQCSPVSFAPKA